MTKEEMRKLEYRFKVENRQKRADDLKEILKQNPNIGAVVLDYSYDQKSEE